MFLTILVDYCFCFKYKSLNFNNLSENKTLYLMSFYFSSIFYLDLRMFRYVTKKQDRNTE